MEGVESGGAVLRDQVLQPHPPFPPSPFFKTVFEDLKRSYVFLRWYAPAWS